MTTSASRSTAGGESEGPPERRAERRLRTLLVSIAIAFPLSVAALIAHFSVDVPVEDQWSTLLLLDRYLDGELTLADWMSPHREHRLLVPRLLLFPLARATGWNLRVEAAVGYLLAVATYAILALWIWRGSACWDRSCDRLTTWRWGLLAVLSLTLFGWQPWENWLWGSQVQTFSSVLFVVLGLRALCAERLGWRRFWIAVMAASFALYSQATAFVFVGVGAGILLIRAIRSLRVGGLARRPLVFLALWMSLGVGHFWLYRVGDLSEPHRLAAAIERPLSWLAYTLVFLGSPLVAYGKALHPYGPIVPGVLAGLVALVLFVWALTLRSRRGQGASSHRLLLGGLGCYGIGVATLTGLGRVGEGMDQAYASRYTSYSLLLWLSILLLLGFSLAESNGDSLADSPADRTRSRLAKLAILLGLCGALVASSLGSLPLYLRVHDFLVEERAQLGEGPSGLNSDQAVIDRGVEILKRHHLSVFRDP